MVFLEADSIEGL